jgi:integrase/recombinase XerD
MGAQKYGTLPTNPLGGFDVGNEDITRLTQAVVDFIGWLSATGNSKKLKGDYDHTLIEFIVFALRENMKWENLFSLDTLRVFARNSTRMTDAIHVLTAFSDYLYEKGAINELLEVPDDRVILPDIYEKYLLYLQQEKAVSKVLVRSSRRVLASLHAYLDTHNIDLSILKIQHIDTFMSEFTKPFCNVTRGIYRNQIRGFLKYIHQEKVIKKDIAHLLVGPRKFGEPRPPKFLRPEEVKKLFGSITLDTPVKIRTYAMLLLSYSLGLRPIEIKRLTLDDVSFQEAEITITIRKTKNPAIMPLPEETLKAIAAYVYKARPQSQHRALFLTAHKPYGPVSRSLVSEDISRIIRSAGLSASAYWLRHTYAQSLLCMGHSIYDIKEMMGHESIRSTQRYLHVDIEHMRKVLFDETL